MKKLSITVRLTFWYSVCLIIAVALAWLIFMHASESVTRQFYSDAVTNAAALARDEIYMTDGMLDFDRRLNQLSNAKIAFYDLDGELLYGRTSVETDFATDSGVRRVSYGGVTWAVYDERISVEGYGDVFLRAYTSVDNADVIVDKVSKYIHILLPSVILLSIIGGYALSKRALRPVSRIVRTAESIYDAGDLQKRIHPSGAHDELYEIASVFDEMLDRISAMFEREKRFTQDASHEMRTPVAAIMAISESALADRSQDEMRSALNDINERTKTLASLVSRLSLLAKMDSGRYELQTESVDLAEILSCVAADASERFSNKRLRINVSGESLFTECDQLLMTRLFMNLTDNACRHSHEDAEIRLSLTENAGTAQIEVADDGPGMTSEQASHVFERFYRADKARSGEGSGLGLAIAMSIARAHGGDIRVESEPGHGARFTVTIPKK